MIKIAEQEIQIRTLRRKGSKRIVLRYNSEQKYLRVTAPKRCSSRQIDKFIKENEAWVLSAVNKADAQQPIPLMFGQIIPILGEDYKISPCQSMLEGQGESPKIFEVLATEKNCADVVTIQLKRILADYIDKEATKRANVIGQEIESISLKDTKSRWGSCSHHGKLNFSWRLIFAPKAVLDYVISHEVAHLKEHNHGAEFWQIVSNFHPTYLQDSDWLKQYGATLFLYGSA